MFRTLIPSDWNAKYLLEDMAGLDTHLGWVDRGDGTQEIGCHFDSGEVVEQAIAEYPVRYANEVMKPEMRAQVNLIREQKELMPAPIPANHPIDIDDKSKIKILGVALTAALDVIDELVQVCSRIGTPEERRFDPSNLKFSELFTMADNEVVQLHPGNVFPVAKSGGYYISQVHTRARELKAQINAAPDVEALKLIDLNSGWPQ